MKSREVLMSELERRLGPDEDLLLSVIEMTELADGMRPMRGDPHSEWRYRRASILGTCRNCGYQWPIAHMPMNATRLAQIVTRMSICCKCGETEMVLLSELPKSGRMIRSVQANANQKQEARSEPIEHRAVSQEPQVSDRNARLGRNGGKRLATGS